MAAPKRGFFIGIVIGAILGFFLTYQFFMNTGEQLYYQNFFNTNLLGEMLPASKRDFVTSTAFFKGIGGGLIGAFIGGGFFRKFFK